MAKEPPQTIGEMRRKSIVTDAEIAAAVDAYLIDPKAGPFRFASGLVLDVAGAINAYRPAKVALNDRSLRDTYRYTMVRTAVILAVPVME